LNLKFFRLGFTMSEFHYFRAGMPRFMRMKSFKNGGVKRHLDNIWQLPAVGT